MKRLGLLSVWAALFLGASAFAGQLPEFSDHWANGGPYTLAGAQGKTVVLFFIEPG
jgi:hypothetical protein